MSSENEWGIWASEQEALERLNETLANIKRDLFINQKNKSDLMFLINAASELFGVTQSRFLEQKKLHGDRINISEKIGLAVVQVGCCTIHKWSLELYSEWEDV